RRIDARPCERGEGEHDCGDPERDEDLDDGEARTPGASNEDDFSVRHDGDVTGERRPSQRYSYPLRRKRGGGRSDAEVEREDAVAEEEGHERAAREERSERNGELRVGSLVQHEPDADQRSD